MRWGLLFALILALPAWADSPSPDVEAREAFMQGTQHYQRGDYPKAAERFERAVELMKDAPDKQGMLRYNLARTYERAGDTSAARRNYEEALRLLDNPALSERIKAQLKQLAPPAFKPAPESPAKRGGEAAPPKAPK